MRAPSVLFCAMLFAPPLWGQRLSGEGTCAAPDQFHQIPAGDRPDHTFAVSKSRCTWSKPFEIAQRAGGGTVVQIRERTGNREGLVARRVVQVGLHRRLPDGRLIGSECPRLSEVK